MLTNAGKRGRCHYGIRQEPLRPIPTKPLAYYWKGINLIGKATVGKDNKMTAPDGTAEAFQKYLELDPNGPMAQTAKDMLATIGATVETGFGNQEDTGEKVIQLPVTGIQLQRSS